MIIAHRKGVAMLSALGLLVILALLSSTFSAHMRLASAFANRDAQSLQANYLAVAGVQDAIARLKLDSPAVDAYTDIWWPGRSPEMTPLGEGGYTLRVSDEAARINISTASIQVLGLALGADKEALAKTVNYRSSKPIFTLDDLRNTDMAADTLSRILMLCTNFGDGRVNINTASADVIATLPGMDSDVAQQVVEFRKGSDRIEGTNDDFVFATSEDIAKVPGFTPIRTAPVIPLIKVNSKFFRVESVGSVYKGKRAVSNAKITAVLKRDINQDVNIIFWEGS